MQYVCFKLSNQFYGIELINVLEVLPVTDITPIVHTPEFIKGVVNLRGNIIALIDLKIFFELPSAEITPESKIIVVSFEDKTAGFLADDMRQIVNHEEVTQDSIPATIAGKMSEFLKGVVNIENQPLMIISLQNIFNSEEFRQFE